MSSERNPSENLSDIETNNSSHEIAPGITISNAVTDRIMSIAVPPNEENPFGTDPGSLQRAWDQMFLGLLQTVQKPRRDYPKVSVSQEEIDEKMRCIICIDEFSLGESATQLPCLHKFHHPCILRWLTTKTTCPTCRTCVGASSAETNGPDGGTDNTVPSQNGALNGAAVVGDDIVPLNEVEANGADAAMHNVGGTNHN